MDFEWDEGKSEGNLRERGFGFDLAASIFLGPVLEAEDTRHDYGEVRIKALGSVQGIILVVIYTDRDGIRRIISARRAKQKERRLWQLFAGL
ncbi:BrnT family toxin [Bosea minatitlanensis]|uniref:BrnT family toxin n=1 Tax=Bosea minatitlanensis TaxID=128782 RepID=A0ABW0F1X6_9HYPH|nr:BrnT family toxin [Bosea minatitlanensis]MCT4492998.1 BrnT family toxin [Bosea minatitlanensis]